MKVKLGGPAYGGLVRVEHCAFMASTAINLNRAGIQVAFGYQQSTLVHWGRADWLCNAVDQGYDLALSCDSDTWADPEDIYSDAMSLMLLAASKDKDDGIQKAILASRPEFGDMGANLHRIALLGFAVGQRSGIVNVWDEKYRKIGLDKFAQSAITPVYAVGSAMVLFNLNWYRRNPRSLLRKWDCPIDGASEDYAHCAAVGKAGGIVLAALANTYHAPNDITNIIQCAHPNVTAG